MGGFVRTDGDRRAAGYTGQVGDCVTRAIAVAAARPYRMVHDELRARQHRHVADRRLPRRWASTRPGVFHDVWRPYLLELGWRWVQAPVKAPRLRPDDLPAGRLIVELPRHLTAVIGGNVHDLYNPGNPPVWAIWTGPTNDTPLDPQRCEELQLFA